MTHLESRKKLSGSEVHRILPEKEPLSKYDVHFDDIKAKHIDFALQGLRRGYIAAYRNERRASQMKFVLEHSRTKFMYGQALKEIEDFASFWRGGKRERALAIWEQWEQRSPADSRDGDIATLAAHAIGRITFNEKGKHTTSQELPFDIHQIRPPERFLALHGARADQHWMRMIQVHYNGEFEGLQGKEALDRFYSRLGSHAQDLIKDANVFKVVRPQRLYKILEGTDREGRKSMNLISLCQAMYNSSKLPIHAYMCDSDDGIIPPDGKYIPLGRYGSVTLRLKKNNIINRSTITFHDTAWHYWPKENEITMVPRPMSQADWKVWPLTKVSLQETRPKPPVFPGRSGAREAWEAT